MENNKKLEDLHNQYLENVNDYLKTKDNLSKENKEKVDKAKSEWLAAWTKFQETLLYLEQLEI
ncbi:hypothetical protein [Ferruginibacter albus]|uniref:hypothetical protein n=1 Tax=Ferruginibacter albus TaxID=2875540 RepID=UPI001CC38D09|nr:hypothetical protein [Ferruginibacter albus]UAY53550.1 hypothetical protein K9M53_07755 [Ferruginibacter albus]